MTARLSYLRKKVRRNVRFRYGADYDALLLESWGRCGCCGDQFRNHYLEPHVDHSHKTGKVRRLVCWPCNQAFGALREDARVALLVADYLILFECEALPWAANEPYTRPEEDPSADPQIRLFP